MKFERWDIVSKSRTETMTLLGQPAETWGRWTVIKRDGGTLLVQCSCGSQRRVPSQLWTSAKRMSVYCRKCAIAVENKRMKFLFPKRVRL